MLTIIFQETSHILFNMKDLRHESKVSCGKYFSWSFYLSDWYEKKFGKLLNVSICIGLNHTHESEHIRLHAGEIKLNDHVRVGKKTPKSFF